jgi:acyl-ACP thioesterase
MADTITREHDREKPECKSFLNVCTSDIDMNEHVNNVCYVRWALDAFSVDFLQKNEVKEISVSFLAEAKEGDRVGLGLIDKGDGKYRVLIIKESDGKELASVKLIF